MSSNESAVPEGYTRRPVPQEETVSGYGLALITFGIGMTLPVFWLGADVTAKVGFNKACWIFLGVCAVLGVLAALTALAGVRSRLSTYMVLQFSFGQHGAKLLNLIMAITLLGFYAATVDIFGSTISSALESALGMVTPAWGHSLWGSILMTLMAIFGLRGLDRLSVCSVPLMGLFLLYTLYLGLERAVPGQLVGFEGGGDSLALAISSTIGMVVLTPVLMPDFTRYARTDADALITILGMVIGFPFVLIVGGLLSISSGQAEIMAIMAVLGVLLPALIVMVFSTWITNTANLYSATLTLATITRTPSWKLTVGGSVLATALALGGFMNHFLDFILTLSIVIPPLASIYLADFFIVNRQQYAVEQLDQLPAFGWPALTSWALASLVAWMTTYENWTLTTQPTLDSLLIALVAYLVLQRLRRPQIAPEAPHRNI
ncbi:MULTISPECIES: cytosine permease [Pseudomonas]|uniref:Cytosine permease n=1 Tax=Pseudomonas juntendi TaxID=2666183 RepID=A0ABD4YIW9_9PSED|nr:MULTISPECIES: cytosine permease [Pseudomonas]MDH0759188.1 cytosine permease [Pseudomonas juntendi]MDH1575430.1 cytosine permease [Pseudomonas sp. GD03746]MDH1919936.1 cytosine permease [Pseudomonas juntendi]QUN68626.1 cytosine permease [Pseudomonas sp. JS425]